MLSKFPTFSEKEKNWIKENISEDLLKFILELCVNTLNENIHLNDEGRRKIFRYKKRMANILSPSTCMKKKKKLIQQGGFLQSLLHNLCTPILSQLSSKAEVNP